jgi:hypothetical protein
MLYSLELRTDEKAATMALHGDAASMGPDRFRDILRALTSVGITRVVVDLHRLPDIDIQVAAALSRASRVLSAQAGSLSIAGAREPVEKKLTTFGVTDRVQLFRTVEEAGWDAGHPSTYETLA